jgi:hypothetical protein
MAQHGAVVARGAHIRGTPRSLDRNELLLYFLFIFAPLPTLNFFAYTES